MMLKKALIRILGRNFMFCAEKIYEIVNTCNISGNAVLVVENCKVKEIQM